MLTDRLIIRKCLPSDIDALLGLLRLLFAIEADFSFAPEKQRRGLEMLLRKETDCCLLVAELDDKVIGMCSAQLLISTAAGGFKALVEDMVVAEGYRGLGIGRRLLTALEDWARSQGVKRLDLLADFHNLPALEFYAHLRWARTDLIALQKKLPGN
ncbi:MAG TPA: GNAT family N-acetyltransferase [Firmicutes bacterium]|nr:GNAT family N-acetyltransferase [Bacillota bacterium]